MIPATQYRSLRAKYDSSICVCINGKEVRLREPVTDKWIKMLVKGFLVFFAMDSSHTCLPRLNIILLGIKCPS